MVRLGRESILYYPVSRTRALVPGTSALARVRHARRERGSVSPLLSPTHIAPHGRRLGTKEERARACK